MSEPFKLHFENSNEQHLDDLDLSSDIPVADMLPLILKELGLDPTADWQLTLVDQNLVIDLQHSFEEAGARSGSTIRIQSGLQRIGRYEITHQIGEGGMGVVYEGYDPNLDRKVAIKVIKPELANDVSMMQRFAREARAISRLSGNVNIVTVYDFVYGQIENRPLSQPTRPSADVTVRGPAAAVQKTPPFFVMEYIDGDSLSDYIERRNSLSLQDASDILTPIAAGLDAAHQQGIIHRDLKPSNILLQPDPAQPGHWIPKIADFGLVRMADDPGGQTKTGMLTGTPYYMSPEQIEGKALTRQTDIYSLGIVVYEMLTGRKPFQDGASTKILMDHLQTSPPPIHQFSDNIPAAVEKAVLKSLSKKPEDRYSSAGEFAKEFAAAIHPAARPSHTSRRRVLVLGSGVLGFFLVAIIAAILLRPPFLFPMPAATPTLTPLTPTPEPAATSIIDPGSSITDTVKGKILFTSKRDGNGQIYAMNRDGSNQQRLTNSNLEERFPFAAIDGRRIIFHAVSAGADPASADSQIYIVDIATKERLPIRTEYSSTRHASWSPINSLELVFAAKQKDDWGIVDFDFKTNSVRPLVQIPGADYYPAWSPDGQKIAFTHYANEKGQIFVVNNDGSGLDNISNSPYSDQMPNWSPDGNKIAFISNRNGFNQIFIMNADGSGQRALETGDLPASRPVWSPEGNMIVFEEKLNGQTDIFSINADGSKLTRLTNDPADDAAPYWP